ncbi:hypothetical protein ATCC90586_004319 [Pythium insidiosum]|nr:hypothetical protein ATCC90586_004319 [Pythium insidiosum]
MVSTTSAASASTTTTRASTCTATVSATPPSTWQYGKGKRKRKGWGPYQSVLRERSVDFNLTLDVQHLRQEIQQLETARDALSTKTMLLRHAPSGSLMKVVREFYRFFRQGFRVDEQRRRRRVITAHNQCDFLHSVVDERVDVGNGLSGVPIFIEMIRRYSLIWRFIALELISFDIITAEDGTVIIRTRGSMHIQILRDTIVALFPHVMADHDIVSRLVGADVVTPASITFYFNAEDKICRYDVDLDFAATFLSLLTNPLHVGILLGDANIAGNAMLGRVEDGVLRDLPLDEQVGEVAGRREDGGVSDVRPTTLPPIDGGMAPPSDADVSQGHQASGHVDIRDSSLHFPVVADALSPLAPWETEQQRWDSDFFLDVVDRYFAVFEHGWLDHWRQHHFLTNYLSRDVTYGRRSGVDNLVRHWRFLSSSFRSVRWACVDMDSHAVYDQGVVTVAADGLYELTTDEQTVRALFHRVSPRSTLAQALVGASIQCASRLTLVWRQGSRLVLHIDEQMQWDRALEPLIADPEVRHHVASHLEHVAHGIGGRSESSTHSER